MKKVIIVSVFLLVALCSFATNIREIAINGVTIEELLQTYEKIQTIAKTRDLVPVEALYQEWQNETWVNDEIHISYYDENGFFIDMLYQEWQNETWVNMMYYSSTNNEYGWPLETLVQMWDPVNQSWMDAAIFTTSYNAQGQPTYSLIQANIAGVWTNMMQMTYTWVSNLLIELLTEAWDFEQSNWVNDNMDINTYNGDDRIEELDLIWEEGNWLNDEKRTYTYDGNHHLMEQLEQQWNGGTWNDQRHSAYTYDGDWNEIEEYEREWQNGWVDFQLKTSTWENGNMISRLVQEWNPGRNWVNLSIQEITYGEVNESDEVTIMPSTSLNNYPNPFNPNTTISFSVSENNQLTKLEIFNVKGQLVKTLVNAPLSAGNYLVEWNGKNDKQKPVVSGFYFCRLTSGKSQRIQKMILMK
jgi:hypothetical protein